MADESFPKSRSIRSTPTWLIALVIIAFLLVIGLLVWQLADRPAFDGGTVLDFALVGFFGALVAGGELVSRYKDAPRRVLASGGAITYIAVNVLAAVAALATVRVFGWEFGLTGAQARWTQVFVAGFGAMALFRSSVMIVTVGDAEIPAGPAALLDAYLKAADRAVDRRRAWFRAAETKDYMKGVEGGVPALV